MRGTTSKEVAFTTILLLTLASAAPFAQQIAPANESRELVVPYDELFTPEAPDIIFSNLDRSSGDRYNSNRFSPSPSRETVSLAKPRRGRPFASSPKWMCRLEF